MLTTTDIRRINDAYRDNPAAEAELLHTLGDPPVDAIVQAALTGMQHGERTVRVAMLWTLRRYPTDTGAAGILAGLRDPERRVREVAMKCAWPYLADEQVCRALAQRAADAGEKRKLRALAMDALCGQVGGRVAGPLPAAAVKHVAGFLHDEAYRTGVLERLVRAQLTPEVHAMLEDILSTGTQEEAALALRALSGEVVTNLGSIEDEDLRARIATGQPAYGRVFYWIPRNQPSAEPA